VSAKSGGIVDFFKPNVLLAKVRILPIQSRTFGS